MKEGNIKTFEDYLNIYKRNIALICDSLCIQVNNPKIEFDELFQKGQIILWRVFENKKANLTNYVTRSIKLGLVNYIERQLKKPLMSAKSLDEILDRQEEDYKI